MLGADRRPAPIGIEGKLVFGTEPGT
ncbi:MAG: hypothetical protein QOF58_3451, partial [Pseudonocardiales bacterium]|nr:hypothetical protein [Pseudonocardiales bacterium]